MIEVRPFMIDIILLAVVVEFLVLRAILWRRGRDHLVAPLFLFLASGAALMAALRFSLTPQQELLIPLALLAALILHAACLVLAAGLIKS